MEKTGTKIHFVDGKSITVFESMHEIGARNSSDYQTASNVWIYYSEGKTRDKSRRELHLSEVVINIRNVTYMKDEEIHYDEAM